MKRIPTIPTLIALLALSAIATSIIEGPSESNADTTKSSLWVKPSGKSSSRDELCRSLAVVVDRYRTRQQVMVPEQRELIGSLGEVASRYPAEAVQWEGRRLQEESVTLSVDVAAYYSNTQNIRSVCFR